MYKNMKTGILSLRECFTAYRHFTGVHKIDWVIAIVVIVAVASTVMYYGDVVATFRAAIIFDESLFSGQLQNFYEKSLEYKQAEYLWGAQLFSPVQYAVIGIFALPVYIVRSLAGFDLSTTLAGLVYMKIVLLSFTMLCGFIIYKIQKLVFLDPQSGKASMFLFITSPLVIYTNCVGWDILPLSVMLMMLYMHLRGRTKLFLLTSFIGVLMKDYAVFLFIPLLLLQEKNLIKILYKFIIGVSGYLFFQLLTFNDTAKQVLAGPWGHGNLSAVIGQMFPLATGTAGSFFVCLFIVICIFTYMCDKKSNNVRNTFFAALCAFAAFAVFTSIHFNWAVIVVPFILLPAFFHETNTTKFKINVILETIFGLCFIVKWMFTDQGFLGNGIFNDMLLSDFVSPEPFKFAGLAEFLGLSAAAVEFGHVLINSLLLACCIGLVINNIPRENGTDATNRFGISFDGHRGLLVLRTVVILPLLALILASAAIPKEITKEVWGYPVQTYQLPVIEETTVIEQHITFAETLSASELMIWFTTEPHNAYQGNTSVKFTIAETESNREVFSEIFPLNTAMRGDLSVEQVLDINNVQFTAGTKYVITLKGMWITEAWYPVAADAVDGTKLKVNGSTVDNRMLAIRLKAIDTGEISEVLNER